MVGFFFFVVVWVFFKLCRASQPPSLAVLTATHVNEANKVCVCWNSSQTASGTPVMYFLTNTNLHRLHNWLFCISFAWLRVFSILSWHALLDIISSAPLTKKKKNITCEDHNLLGLPTLLGHRSSTRRLQAARSWALLHSCSPGHTCNLDVWRLLLST